MHANSALSGPRRTGAFRGSCNRSVPDARLNSWTLRGLLARLIACRRTSFSLSVTHKADGINGTFQRAEYIAGKN